MQRPAPLPWTPERDRSIGRRSAIINAIAATLILAAILPNLWPAIVATAKFLGLR